MNSPARIICIISVLISFAVLQGCSTILSTTRSEPFEDNNSKRSLGTVMDDEWLETKALVNLDKANPRLAQSHIVVTSYNGIVLLAGQVATEELRLLAAKTVANIKHVKRVHNELTLTGKTNMVVRSNDSWITTKIKSKMLASTSVEGARVKVVTENGVVYLMGLLTRDEGDRAADVARKTSGVQKVVRIFEYVQ